jgi:hypothetical protein
MKESSTVGHDGRATLLLFEAFTFALQADQPTFNQYRSKPEGDVSGGKDTEVLMARLDDYCKRHPLDNLYNASARLLMSSDSEPTAARDFWKTRSLLRVAAPGRISSLRREK